MRRQKNIRYNFESTPLRKKRLIQPGFWIGILTLAALLGFTINPWFQSESVAYAAGAGLKLDISGGVYEIGKPNGRVVVLFFSFPG